ncbi:DUF5641 domain-containing protein [Trichonephila clavata]|uniref:DUF5641 domain-containing protein n=1 Tax=Trichonephila clavata TaxID=2740835 RepID=A0A8X6H509_TRICU|nr:DUF5641 domain-containing protein [Trichonephila clavata]
MLMTICSVDSDEEARQVYHEAKLILSEASMNLTKWKTNSSLLKEEIETVTSREVKLGFPDSSSKYHCPGDQNPADKITRESSVKQLSQDNSWKFGPPWLSDFKSSWPMQENWSICCVSEQSCSMCCESDNYDNSESDIVPVFNCAVNKPILNNEDFSTLRRLLRVTSFVFRFIYNARNSNRRSGPITSSETSKALIYFIKMSQENSFSSEINNIKLNKPLTYVYNDVNEPDPLTPSHFTVGSRLTTLPSPKLNANSINVELTKKWKYRQLLLDHFWKRFFKEYLLELRSVMFTKQSKNIPNLKMDDVVLIREDNVKHYNWKFGRIKKLFPGRDRKVRSCEIQLSKGVIKRPVERLYNLEVKNTG